MEASYWRKRWEDRRIGWHEGRPNAFLTNHLSKLGTAPGRVFVPLCGKSEDLAFIASHGHEVVGVDLVETGLREFFREHAAEPTITNDGRFVTLRHDSITLLAGDFFSLTKADVGDISAVYDRAAIVALPPDMRARYVPHLRSLVPNGTRILTVTYDYDEAKLSGPPFAVPEAELRRLYEGATIESLETAPLKEASGALTPEMGAKEHVWLITL